MRTSPKRPSRSRTGPGHRTRRRAIERVVLVLYNFATAEGLAGEERDRFVIDAVKEAFTLSEDALQAQVEDKGCGEVWGKPAATMAYGVWQAGLDRTDERHQELAMVWVLEALASHPWKRA